MKNYQITQWCARFIREQVQPGDFCIDATMGKGNDTLLLSMLAGPPAGFWPLMFKKRLSSLQRNGFRRQMLPKTILFFWTLTKGFPAMLLRDP